MRRERLLDLDAARARLAARGRLRELRLPVSPRTSTVNGSASRRDWPVLRFGSRRVTVDPGFPDEHGAHPYAYLHVPVGAGSWRGCRYRVRCRLEPGDVLVVREPWAEGGGALAFAADNPGRPIRWRRARELPRDRCRTRLHVVSVRPERVGRAAWVWVLEVRRARRG